MSQVFQFASTSFFAALLLLACGCSSENAGNAGGNAGATGADTEQTQAAIDEVASRCENRFEAAYNQLQPDRLGISANVSSTAAQLNEWLVSCEEDQLVDTQLPAPIDSAVSLEFKTRLSARRFGARDIHHVRDSILARSIATQILDVATDDRERIVSAFDHVMQHVELLSESNVPLSPFHILMTGQGSAEDRTWVFAEVMTQMHFETLVVRSATDKDAWLIGVLLNDDVLLFDPLLGIAIPGMDETGPLPKSPATLKQALADPKVFANLSSDGFKHPLDGADFSKLSVEIAANSTRWSSRMNIMQSKLAGDRSVMVYDAIADAPDAEGTFSRMIAAGKERWSAEDVGLWMHPEIQSDRISRDSEADNREIAAVMERFQAPVSFKQFNRDGKAGVEFNYASHGLLKTRIKQLSGLLESSTTSALMRIREEEQPEKLFFPGTGNGPIVVELPAFLKNTNNRAARDSLFFIAECQRSVNDVDSSVSTFRNYIRKYPRGERVNASLLKASLGLMDTNRSDEAVRSLKKISGPTKPLADWLLQRLGEKSTPEPAIQEKENKVQPAPKTDATESKPEPEPEPEPETSTKPAKTTPTTGDQQEKPKD